MGLYRNIKPDGIRKGLTPISWQTGWILTRTKAPTTLHALINQFFIYFVTKYLLAQKKRKDWPSESKVLKTVFARSCVLYDLVIIK